MGFKCSNLVCQENRSSIDGYERLICFDCYDRWMAMYNTSSDYNANDLTEGNNELYFSFYFDLWLEVFPNE